MIFLPLLCYVLSSNYIFVYSVFLKIRKFLTRPYMINNLPVNFISKLIETQVIGQMGGAGNMWWRL